MLGHHLGHIPSPSPSGGVFTGQSMNWDELTISDVTRGPGLGHQKTTSGDFPGGPVVKTLRSQCRGPGFHPWSGN